jgi:hypothetical protein
MNMSLSAQWQVRWRFIQGLQLPNALLQQEGLKVMTVMA